MASECSSRTTFLTKYFPYPSWLQGGPNKNHGSFHLVSVQFDFSFEDGGAAHGATSSVYTKTNAWSVLLPKHVLYICV